MGYRVRGDLGGEVPGPGKGQTGQEDTARAPGWRPGGVGRLEEQVGFLEEARGEESPGLRERRGKRKEEPRGKGWVGASVNLRSLCS